LGYKRVAYSLTIREIDIDDIRLFVQYRPDLYDYESEFNRLDDKPNIILRPLLFRFRKVLDHGEQVEDEVDWLKRKTMFKRALYIAAFKAYSEINPCYDYFKENAFPSSFLNYCTLGDNSLPTLPSIPNTFITGLKYSLSAPRCKKRASPCKAANNLEESPLHQLVRFSSN